MKQRKGKRPRPQAQESSPPKRKVDENSPVILSFKNHRQELDYRYDKHERLVKCSRDVAIASKRIIFNLQRVAGASDMEQLFKEADEKFVKVKELLNTIALELEGEDPLLFTRAYSPGVQEYIRALLKFSNEDGKDLGLSLNPFDYVLGIADLTGELMRFCINSASSGDQNTPFEVCSFLREIHNAFVAFGNVSREIASKLRVLKASMNKVEVACYTLKVRGSEIPQFALAEALGGDFTSEERDFN